MRGEFPLLFGPLRRSVFLSVKWAWKKAPWPQDSLEGEWDNPCQDPGSYTQNQPVDSSTSTPWRLLNAPPCWETALADGGAQTANTFNQPPRARGRGSGAAGRERRPRGRAGAGPAVYKLARRPAAADNTALGSSAPAATIAATAAATSDAR